MLEQPDELRLLSPKDTARELGCDLNEIERMILAGDLRGVAVSEKGPKPFRRLHLKVLQTDVMRLAKRRRAAAASNG